MGEVSDSDVARMTDRTDLEGRLANQRRRRGEATLAGATFDSTPIAETETALDALSDAETEKVRLERAAAAQAAQARRVALKKDRAAAVEDFLDGCPEYQDVLRRAREIGQGQIEKLNRVRELDRRLGDATLLGAMDLMHALGGLQVAELKQYRGVGARFGPIALSGGSLFMPPYDWRTRMQKLLQSKGQGNGTSSD